MANKAKQTRGMRPTRSAWTWGFVALAGIALSLKGIADMRATGASGSPFLMLGLFPALLAPIGFIYYLLKIPVVRDLRSGKSAIARWTLTPDEFRGFCEADARIAADTRTTNFYKPPRESPPDGLDVIFANDGVLIGDGYFPLSTTGGRRVTRVRTIGSRPPMIEFGTILETRVRTSGAGSKAVRTAETLRVPVSMDAARFADDVARVFDSAIAYSR